MESPVAAVKSAINVSSILKLLAGTVIIFAALDALNLSDWILYPVTTAKAKFGKAA